MSEDKLVQLKIENKCFYLPEYHKENYLQELEILQIQVEKLVFSQQYEILKERKIRVKIIKMRQFYHIPKDFAEILLTHYINIVFSNPHLINHKGEQMATLFVLLNEMKSHQKTDLVVDWKIIYDFLFQGPLGNNVIQKFGLKHLSSYLGPVLSMLKRYYSQESCREVFDLYKSIFGQNSQKMQQNLLVNSFFKWDLKIPSQIYLSIFKEVHDLQYLANKNDKLIQFIWNFHNFQAFDITEYIDEILESAIDEIQSYIPTKISAQKKVNFKLVQHIQLLVKLLQPKNKTQYEIIWKNIKRIFTILKQYIHHKNYSATWSSSVLTIIQLICQEFIKKVGKDQFQQKILDQIQAKRQKINQEKQSDNLEQEEEEDEEEEENEQQQNLQQAETEIEEAVNQEQNLDIEQQQNKENENQTFDYKKQLISLVLETLKSDKIDEDLFQQFEDEVKDNLLMQEHVDSFFELITPVLQQIVYLQSDQAAEIIKQVLVIESKKTIEIILPRVYSQLENIETKGNKPIKILKLLVPYLLDRDLYKQGLYEILNIFKYTGGLLTASNFSLGKSIWGLYSYIFSYFPVWDPEDLQNDFLQKNPDKSEVEFREILNENEDIDMFEFYQQYSEFALQAYNKILETFNYVENQKGEPSNTESFCYQSPHNIFFTYAFNCSPSILKISIVSLVQSLSKIQINAQKYFSYAINAFTLKAPQEMLKALLEKTINEVLVKKKEEKNKEEIKIPTKFEFENQQEILQNYQLEHINKDSLKWYLDILDDLFTFSGSHIEQYDDLIYKLVVVCIQNEEEVIFKMGIRLVHKILISNLSDYIKEFEAYPIQVEQDKLGFVNFHKNLGKNLQIKEKLCLNEITQQQRDYAKKVYSRMVEPVFKRFQSEIFKEELNSDKMQLDPFDNFSEIVEKFYSAEHLKQKRSVIEEFKRGFKILKIMYCSISPRVYEIQENKFHEIYDKFEKYYFFEEYKNEQIRYIEFIEQFCDFIINSNYLSNLYIVQGFISLWKEIFEEQKILRRISLTKKWVHQYRQQNSVKNPKKRTLNRRFYLFYKMNTYLERLQEYRAYVFNCDRLDKLNLYSILFCFYPLGRHTSQIYVLYNQMNGDGSLNQSKYIKKTYEYISQQLDISSPQFLPSLLLKDKSLQTKLNYIILRSVEFKRNFIDLNPSLYEIFIQNFKLTLQYDQINDQLSQQHFSRWYVIILESINSTTSNFNLLKQETSDKFQKTQPVIKTCESFNEFNQQYNDKQKALQREQEQNQMPQKREEFIKNLEQVYAEEIQKPTSTHKKQKTLNIMKQCFKLNDISPEKNLDYLTQIYDNLLNEDIKLRKMSEIELLVEMIKLKHSNLTQEQVELNENSDYKNRSFLEFCQLQYQRDFSQILQKNQSISQNVIRDSIQTNQLNRKFLKKTLNTENLQISIKNHKILQNFKENPEIVEKFLTQIKEDLHFFVQSGTDINLSQLFPTKTQFITKFIISYMNQNSQKKMSNYMIRLQKYLIQFLGYDYFIILKKVLKDALENVSDQKNTIFTIQSLAALFKALVIRHKFSDFNQEQLKEAKQFTYESIAQVYYCNDKNVTSKLFSQFLSPAFSKYKVYQYQDLFDYLLSEEVTSKIQLSEANKFVKIQELYLDQMQKYDLKFLDKQQMLIEQLKQPFIFDLKVIESQAHKLANLFYNSSRLIYFKDYQQFKKENNQDLEEEIIKNKEQFYQINENYIAEQNNQVTQIMKGFIEKALEQDDKNYYYAQLIIDCVKQLGHIPAKGFNGKVKSNTFHNLKQVLEFLIQADEKLYPTKQDIRVLMRTQLMQLCFTRYDQKDLQQVLKLVTDNLDHPNWKNRQKILIFYQGVIYFNLYAIQNSQIDIFEPIFPLLIDQDKNVSQTAQSIYSDFFKLIDQKELKKRAINLKNLAADKKKDTKDREKALYGLMSVLLAHPNEIFDFTEGVLEVILKNKNLGTQTKDFLKQFLSKFFKSYNKEDYEDDSQIKLSTDMEQRLREIAIPYNYFA